jgi:hypothetical protein
MPSLKKNEGKKITDDFVRLLFFWPYYLEGSWQHCRPPFLAVPARLAVNTDPQVFSQTQRQHHAIPPPPGRGGGVAGTPEFASQYNK